jgi:hypothetical protein
MKYLASCVTPYQEDQGFFCWGPMPLAPVVRTTAAVLVCPKYFISPVPSIYIGVEHSPIRHLGRYPMGVRKLHMGISKGKKFKNQYGSEIYCDGHFLCEMIHCHLKRNCSITSQKTIIVNRHLCENVRNTLLQYFSSNCI